jgi:putative phosphoesterase
MTIGIFSDTHDHVQRIRQAVDLFLSWGCGLVIHAGDFVAPFAVRELRRLTCPVHAVFGNNDGEKAGLAQAFALVGTLREPPYAFEALNTRILVLHDQAFAASLARSGDYDLVVCGHTHNPEIQAIGKCLVVNPGECCGWLTGRATIARYFPATGKAEIVELPE